jgi:hypothetical protein
MIEDGVNGYVLDNPRDVPALAGRVDELRKADRRQAMGRAAAAITDRVSMARHAGEMLALYDELRIATNAPAC